MKGFRDKFVKGEEKKKEEAEKKWYEEKMRSLLDWQKRERCVIVPMFRTSMDTLQCGFTLQREEDRRAEIKQEEEAAQVNQPPAEKTKEKPDGNDKAEKSDK